jgi:hypothetical protein
MNTDLSKDVVPSYAAKTMLILGADNIIHDNDNDKLVSHPGDDLSRSATVTAASIAYNRILHRGGGGGLLFKRSQGGGTVTPPPY